MIYIKTDNAIQTLRRLNKMLSQEQLALAESRAINKTIMKARTQSRREIRKVYNISYSKLKGINVIPSTPGTLKASLYGSRKPIAIDAFAPKQETSTGSRRITKKGALKVVSFKRAKAKPSAGVSIEIFKGKRINIPFAFLILGGKARVFARGAYKMGTQYGFVQRFKRVNKSGSDTPVKPLITLSEFGTILNKKVMGEIGRMVKVEYPADLERQIIFLASQAARP